MHFNSWSDFLSPLLVHKLFEAHIAYKSVIIVFYVLRRKLPLYPQQSFSPSKVYEKKTVAEILCAYIGASFYHLQGRVESCKWHFPQRPSIIYRLWCIDMRHCFSGLQVSFKFVICNSKTLTTLYITELTKKMRKYRAQTILQQLL